MNFRYGATVTILRGGGYDPDTGDRIDYTEEIEVPGCFWAPRTQGAGPSSGSVDNRGRQGVIEGLTLYAPYGAPIRHDDRVRLPIGAPLDGPYYGVTDYGDEGEVWEIDGEPGPWKNPITGRQHGMEVAIRRSAG